MVVRPYRTTVGHEGLPPSREGSATTQVCPTVAAANAQERASLRRHTLPPMPELSAPSALAAIVVVAWRHHASGLSCGPGRTGRRPSPTSYGPVERARAPLIHTVLARSTVMRHADLHGPGALSSLAVVGPEAEVV